MNKDIILGVLIGVILTVILVGIGGFFLYPKLSQMLGLPGTGRPASGSINGPSGNYGQPPSEQQQQSQGNGTMFGCPELKLIGATAVKSNVPFTVQNTDSKPHTITISITEYNFAAGEEKTITINGEGVYHPGCDGYANVGELNVGQ